MSRSGALSPPPGSERKPFTAPSGSHAILQVFELSLADWAMLCLSEGVGVPGGYRVRQVAVELYCGATVHAYTLAPGLLRAPVELPPSARYLGLIRKGARELGLTGAWQDRLAAIRTAPFGSRDGSSRDSPLREYERGGSDTVYI